jgi:hypothetical protein
MMSQHSWSMLTSVFCGAMLLAGSASAAESPDFERQILPLLYNRCFSCHSEKAREAKADLRLDSAAAIRESGVVVPGKPDESALLIRTSLPHTDEDLMPPLKGGSLPLNEAERVLLRRWIADGAQTGKWQKFNHRQPAVDPQGPALRRAEAPNVARQIDEIVERYHAARGTQRNEAIDDETFVRRVYLDVAGRIPTLTESTQFLADDASDKRARLIDALVDGEGYVSHMFNWKADQLRLVTKGFPGQPGWMYDAWVKEAVRSGMKYDEYVRRLVTAEGYLWDNGAVGFYQRDLGMPLDHMSNLMRLFLGTRIECAQCHDHPFEPITQQDFYQLTAYTFGVSNLYSSAGYSTDNVKHWDELLSQLDAMKAPEALRQMVSGTVAPLKRLTRDTDHRLTYPETYASDPALRGKQVEFRTLFGDEAPVTEGNPRAAFAAWMTSPRNPRFAVNIANRLWKRVMGIGLIEPVDALSPVNRPEPPELLDFLAETMVRFGYDERSFLAALLNTRLYQSRTDRIEPEPGTPFALRGPQLRRLSAEQVWDSLLVLLVEDLDERRGYSSEQASRVREEWAQLDKMTAAELLERARKATDAKVVLRRVTIEIDEQKQQLRQAQDGGDEAAVARIQSRIAALTADGNAARGLLRIDGPTADKPTDPRRRGVSSSHIRAAEIPTPLPLGHFLRQFGQSDRREIDAFNTNANVTHALALMNGELTKLALDEDSYLRTQVRSAGDEAERLQATYRSILVRSPSKEEAERCRTLGSESATFESDLIWALLNTPEFLFIQ